MSKTVLLFSLYACCFCMMVTGFAVADGPCEVGPNGKVTICHVPPGNPDNAHTISVSPNAANAHLAHGDYCGPCVLAVCAGDDDCDEGQVCVDGECVPPGECQTDSDCDDENACTTDVCNPGVGCIHVEIDSCVDGDPCTVDSCDPESGCVYEPLDCEDDDPCTINECFDGECFTAVIDCPDGQVCEDGECVSMSDEVVLFLDIQPRRCPNGIRRGTNATIWVALLGTEDVAVVDVDPASLELHRTDGAGEPLSPDHKSYKDLTSPFDGELCDCHKLGKDGTVDLRMRFKTRDLVEALTLEDLDRGSTVELILTGALEDGTPFSATDCVRIAR